MSTTVPMPQFGEGISEARVTRWYKREGDRVETGDLLCEVSANDQRVDVLAPGPGWVEQCMVVEDQFAPAAASLCRIDATEPNHTRSTNPPVPSPSAPDRQEVGAAAAEADPFEAAVSYAVSPVDSIDTPRATIRMQVPQDMPRPEPLHAHVSAAADPPQPIESQALHAHASEATAPLSPPESTLHAHVSPAADDIELFPHEADKPRARVTAAGEERLAAPESFAELRPDGNRRGVLSPVVQNLAAEYGVNLEKIIGSGESGEITDSDVLAAAARASIEGEAIGGFAESGRAGVERDLGFACIEVGCDRMAGALEVHQAEFRAEHGYELSLTSFFSLAVCNSLLEFSVANSRTDLVTGEFRECDQVDLRIVRAGPGSMSGAVVVKGAERLTLRELERKSHQAPEDDAADGTFAVYDLAPTGVAIAVPQVDGGIAAALSVGAVARRPVFRDDAVVASMRAVLGLAWDRRAVNDLAAFQILAAMKERIEDWDWVTLAG